MDRIKNTLNLFPRPSREGIKGRGESKLQIMAYELL